MWTEPLRTRRLLRAARSAADFVELDGLPWTEINPDRGRHVHTLRRAERGARRWLAKSADVWRTLGSTGTGDYRTFAGFAQSLFEEGDGTVPIRSVRHPDEPEIYEMVFHRQLLSRCRDAIETISDQTPPELIEEPELRALFVLYLGRKERLIIGRDDSYENVFTHHGRDVVLEVFASLLGRSLGIAVPQNRFGLRTFEFIRPGTRGRVRRRMPYALSAMVAQGGCMNLLGFLRQSAERELAQALGWELHSANPLALAFFLGELSGARRDAGNLLVERLKRPADLIRSDLLDVLLDAREDRSIEEFLLPRGADGPVFTVDYGESLFPELAFGPDEPHFVSASQAHTGRVVEHFRRAHELPPGNPYRREAGRFLKRFLGLPEAFFTEFFTRLPTMLLGGVLGSDRYSMDRRSPVAHLRTLSAALEQAFGLSISASQGDADLHHDFH